MKRRDDNGDEFHYVDELVALKRRERAYRQELRIARRLLNHFVNLPAVYGVNHSCAVERIARIDKVLKRSCSRARRCSARTDATSAAGPSPQRSRKSRPCSPLTQRSNEMDALELAVLFHVIYERKSAEFNYVTRTETRVFDPESANGKLMVATCGEVLKYMAEDGLLAAAKGE